jgi:hypothetical protein
MPKKYRGDIKGDFLFSVQKSLAADRFTSDTTRDEYLDYYFSESELKEVNKELEDIKSSIGVEAFNNLLAYYDSGKRNAKYENSFEWQSNKKDFADYILGRKIRNCIIKTGSCSFEVEI